MFRCECTDGFGGAYCEANVNECISQPCVNGARCVDDVNGFRCVCLDGFAGLTCK